MKWKVISRFKRRNVSPIEGRHEPRIQQRKTRDKPKRQLKQVSAVLGETWLTRIFRGVLYSKACYLVLESPHARLAELSGNSVSEIASDKAGESSDHLDDYHDSTRGPRWFVEGSALYLSMHFENDVYSEADSFDETIATLSKAMKPRFNRRRLRGAIVYLHQHDLINGLSASWLNKMASMLVAVSAKTGDSIPVYIVLEGASDTEAALSVLNTPIGMFRDRDLIGPEQFGQWFFRVRDTIANRLINKTLKETQYVHNLASRRLAFLAVHDVGTRLDRLRTVAEDFNHRWHFSQHACKPWIRGLFIATEPDSGNLLGSESSVQIDGSGDSPPQTLAHYRWWQKFSHALLQDQHCDQLPQNNRNTRPWRPICAVSAVALSVLGGALHIWSDYTEAGILGSKLFVQMNAIREFGVEGQLKTTYPPTLEKLNELDRVNGDLKGLDRGVNVFTGKVADKGMQEAKRQSERIIQRVFPNQLDHEIISVLNQNSDFDVLYSALKAYLYLHTPRDGRNDYLMWWFGREWQVKFEGDPVMRQQMAETLSLYLQESNAQGLSIQGLSIQEHSTQEKSIKGQDTHAQIIDGQKAFVSIDTALVESTRAKLRVVPLHQRLYMDISQRADEAAPAVSDLKGIIGYSQMELFKPDVKGVPYLYTVNGYKRLFVPHLTWVLKQSSSDSWVLGEEGPQVSDLRTIKKEIYRLYIDDYLGAWKAFLRRLSVSKTASMDDLQNNVQKSMGRGGAIRRTLQYVYDNTANYHSLSTQSINALTNITSLNGAGATVPSINTAAAKLATSNASAGLERVSVLGNDISIGTETNGVAQTYLEPHPMAAISAYFGVLNRTLDADKNSLSPMDQIDERLASLEEYITGLDRSVDQGNRLFEATIQKMNGGLNDPISQLIKSSKHMPEPLNRWLLDLSKQSWMHMMSGSRSIVRKAYKRELYRSYVANIESRFPMVSGSDSDVELDHFTAYFSHEGAERRFFTQYVKHFVAHKGDTAYEKRVHGIRLGLSSAYLSQLSKAQRIRTSLFEGDSLFVELQLKPIYLDANITRFDLSLLDDRLSYRHGPQKLSRINWPVNNSGNDIAIEFEDYNGKINKETLAGEWSLFRLINAYGKESMPGGRRYRLSFEIEGQRAVYEAVGDSLTPDLLDLLGSYQLPSSPLI